MSDIWRRNGTVCTDDPRCFRECRCSRWPDYTNRFGDYVVPHPGELLPCYYLTFDAINDLITLAGISLGPPFTMVAWTRRTAAGLLHPILGNSAAVTPRWAALVANTVRLAHTHDTTSTVNATVAWSHLAVVGQQAVNGIAYRDGVDVTAAAAFHHLPALTYDRIGMCFTPNLWWGQLAAIGLAPAVLNIPAMWAAGDFHRPLDPAVFTIACWNMRNEGGAGTTLIDEAVGNDGTFLAAGSPAWGGLMSVGGPAGWTD